MSFVASINSVRSLDVSFDSASATLPPDYASRVPKRGDHTRDAVTKGFFYLAEQARFAPRDYILVASEFGNASALADFHAACMHVGGTAPSAVQFATATTSTTATSLNIQYGVTGGNLTINAGRRSLQIGLSTALSLLEDDTTNMSVHLFFSDVRGVADSKDLKSAALYYFELTPASVMSIGPNAQAFGDTSRFLTGCRRSASGQVPLVQFDRTTSQILYSTKQSMVA